MKNLFKWSFVHALGILVYVSIVATIMSNGEKLFGKEDTVITIIAFLLLFTLSAFTVGLLGLGKPIMLYLDGKKKEAVTMASLTAGWLFVFIVTALIISACVK